MNIVTVLLKIVAFFVVALVLGVFLHKLIEKVTGGAGRDRKRYAILAFAMCLFFSYGAEQFFGVADITGAYIAGLIISNTSRATYVAAKCETISYMFFSPVFFASIGAKVVLPEMSASIVLFSLLLIAVAVITKVIGCGLGAKLCRYSGKECVQIGVGMICRGEVALIVTTKGISLGMLQSEYVAPVILMVVTSTICTPILLKLVYRGRKEYGDLVQSDLVDQYEAVQDLDLAAQSVLEDHEQLVKQGKALQEKHTN